jgi:hypothetical protein
MSGTLSPTVAAVPPLTDSAARALAAIAAQTGTVTDFNPGSNVRTFTEVEGGIVEMQGYGAQALVLQGMVYGAMGAVGITPNGAQAATGTVTFSTTPSGSGSVPSPISIGIPSTTLVGTGGGVQFSISVSGLVLTSGSSSVTAPIVCTQGGAIGNVGAGTINSILTSVGYPLYVWNAAATSGGVAAETPSQTTARFSAKQATFGLCSPIAVANACVGVTNGSGEVCKYASAVEPWLLAGSGAGSGTAGFNVYVDDGSGGATSGLVTAVQNYLLNGNSTGFRPVGMPFGVYSASGILVNILVSGQLFPGLVSANTVASGISTAIPAYFNGINFSGIAEQAQLSAVVANTALGFFSALSVTMTPASGGSAASTINATYSGRVIPNTLTIDIA